MDALALLHRNTDSVTFMAALPALHRAANADPGSKKLFLMTLTLWLSDKKTRNYNEAITSANVLRFLATAQRLQCNVGEKNALDVIVINARGFAPAEYLQGAD